MKVLLVLIGLISLNTYSAPMKMKPGLWEIKMKIFHDGKEFDPMAEVKKQIEKMPEAQKKLILEQMSKGGPEAQNNITTVCYTKEMVDSPEKIAAEDNEESDCDHKVKSSSANKVVSEFTCKDGNRGTTTWELVSPIQTRILTDAVDKKGKKSQMKYEAKFLKANCGKAN